MIKKLLLTLLLLTPLLTFAQLAINREKVFYNNTFLFNQKELKYIVIRSGLMFLSGAADGTSEALRFHYIGFKQVFPEANDQFWNPNVSWKNKYRNGDYLQGEKFLGSSNVFVWTTDGYHMMRALRNCTMIAGVVINFGSPKPWYIYIAEGIIYYISYTTGFTVTYDLIFKE